MKISHSALVCAFWALLCLAVCPPASAQGPKTFDLTAAPYNADTTGINDDAPAINQAVKDAVAYGNANGHPAVTVLLPAGTYLVKETISIQNSTNLTFTGASAASTMIWYTRKAMSCFDVESNNNVTFGNFSADVQKINGQYDLNITQGTITSVNRAAKQVTINVEDGYPLLNQPNIQHSPTIGNTYLSAWLWTLPDPHRIDFDDWPNTKVITPSADGKTAVVTCTGLGKQVHVGEPYLIWAADGDDGTGKSQGTGGSFLGIGFNTGTCTYQNINFYGGSIPWMGVRNYDMGACLFNNIYCGPPPYQPDRHLTCNQGWAMSQSNPGSLTIENSKFIGTWDDVFDVGCNETTVISQSDPTHIIAQNSNGWFYHVGDKIEFVDDMDAPAGAIYGSTTIDAVSQTGGGTPWHITMHDPVTIRHLDPNSNLAKADSLTDLTQAGPVTAINTVFNNSNQRHVYFRSGVSLTVTGCTFLDGTPLLITGWEGIDGEGPSEARNVTITGNTFLRSNGVFVGENFGSLQGVSGSNVTISGNKFLNCGRIGEYDSQPVVVLNTTGVTVANNWFDNNWGANVQLQYDANVTVSGNTFQHPNEIAGSSLIDTSVVYLANVVGGTVSGNLLYGAGPLTRFLSETGANVTGVTGLPNGITQIDGPLVLLLNSSQGTGH